MLSILIYETKFSIASSVVVCFLSVSQLEFLNQSYFQPLNLSIILAYSANDRLAITQAVVPPIMPAKTPATSPGIAPMPGTVTLPTPARATPPAPASAKPCVFAHKETGNMLF